MCQDEDEGLVVKTGRVSGHVKAECWFQDLWTVWESQGSKITYPSLGPRCLLDELHTLTFMLLHNNIVSKANLVLAMALSITNYGICTVVPSATPLPRKAHPQALGKCKATSASYLCFRHLHSRLVRQVVFLPLDPKNLRLREKRNLLGTSDWITFKSRPDLFHYTKHCPSSQNILNSLHSLLLTGFGPVTDTRALAQGEEGRREHLVWFEEFNDDVNTWVKELQIRKGGS